MNDRNALGRAMPTSQQSMDPTVLRVEAARFFTTTLRVPVLPDWGVLPNGACQCEKEAGCLHPGKHPSVKAPRDKATHDMFQIASWSRIGRNLAVVPYGYIVVDIEIKDGKNGLVPFTKWCELAGLDPNVMLSTFTVRSGGGGLHLWYWLPENYEPPKGMDGWLPDVDIKTSRKNGDKATIPGSRHRSGGIYTFELNGAGGTGFNLPARAPQVLLDEVAAGRAWRPLPTDKWPRYGSTGGSVKFAEFMAAAESWRLAEILPPGSPRPPKSVFAGMQLGSLTDAHHEWVRNVTK